MAHLKRSVVKEKAKEHCLAHAIIIAIAKAENDPNYTSNRDGRKIRPVVQKLLAKTGIDLSGGGGVSRNSIIPRTFLGVSDNRLSKPGVRRQCLKGRSTHLSELIYSVTMSNDTIT